MLNLKKEAKQLDAGELKIVTCPVCKAYISFIFFMQDASTKLQSRWYSCSCGVIFQDKFPNKVYDKKYWDDHDHTDKKLRDAFEYPVRIYAPIIEELIYGRRVLMVGKQTAHQEEAFAARGWVPTSIDKNPASNPHIVADFEEYKFPEKLKYSMIWFYNTLECLKDPIASLDLCKKILAEDGIIYVSTPDTDFVHTRGSSGFINWKLDMHYLMWNRRSLKAHLEKLGFNVILTRQNYEHRFPSWDEFHLLAQRKFF